MPETTRRNFLLSSLLGLGTVTNSGTLEKTFDQPEQDLAKKLLELECRVIVDFGSEVKAKRAYEILFDEELPFEIPISYGDLSLNYDTKIIMSNYVRIYLEREHGFKVTVSSTRRMQTINHCSGI